MYYQKPVCQQDIALIVRFAGAQTPGANEFEVLAKALSDYQAALLQRAIEAPRKVEDSESMDAELIPNFIQDAATANTLLQRLLTEGFNEVVFTQSFYELK